MYKKVSEEILREFRENPELAKLKYTRKSITIAWKLYSMSIDDLINDLKRIAEYGKCLSCSWSIPNPKNLDLATRRCCLYNLLNPEECVYYMC